MQNELRFFFWNKGDSILAVSVKDAVPHSRSSQTKSMMGRCSFETVSCFGGAADTLRRPGQLRITVGLRVWFACADQRIRPSRVAAVATIE